MFKNIPPQQKKAIVRFFVGGAIALLLKKSETLVNKKADAYFGPDEPKKNKKN